MFKVKLDFLNGFQTLSEFVVFPSSNLKVLEIILDTVLIQWEVNAYDISKRLGQSSKD